MAELHDVPVVEVHTGNIKEIWPSLVLAIKSSAFVAIDTELSGLGDRKQLFAKSIDDRYKAICDVAKTRSIIALGISCFKLDQPFHNKFKESSTGDACEDAGGGNFNVKFVVQTFNIFVLCAEEYVVEPMSVRFLIEHGFDFNRQYASGLPYTRGNDKYESGEDFQHLRQLFVEIAMNRVPVVLHNALVDLVFLYQNLYSSVPTTLASFVTDLSQIFSSGIYDTKFMAEFRARMPASFLEYAFRKCQRDNCCQKSSKMPYVDISFLHYHEAMLVHIAFLTCGLKDEPCSRDVGKTTLCQHFASHGWCAAGLQCPNSHDVDMILDSEEWSTAKKKRAKKSRQRGEKMQIEDSTEDVPTSEEARQSTPGQPSTNDDSDESAAIDSVSSVQLNDAVDAKENQSNHTSKNHLPANRSGGHRAGFDAFMTGYIFASLIVKHGKVRRTTEVRSLGDFGIAEELCNKVYLGGKDFPLQISTSSFAKPSKLHTEKWERLQSNVST